MENENTTGTEQAAEQSTTDAPANTAAAEAPAGESRPEPTSSLPENLRIALQFKAQQRTVLAELAKKNWGQNLDLATLKAIADWGMRHGVDVAQEIDVLGNRIYLNAKFYLRGLAYLIDAGRVEYVYAEHVAVDPRIPADSPEAKRRLEMRVMYNLPDVAIAAVVARIKLYGVPMEFTGAKWCGGKGKKTVKGRNGGSDYEVMKDPIGEDMPVETAETRALRRCLRLMVTHIPAEAKRRDEMLDDAALELEDTIHNAQHRANADIALAERQARPRGVHTGGYEEPRALGSGSEAPPVRSPIFKREMASIESPYAEPANPRATTDSAAE